MQKYTLYWSSLDLYEKCPQQYLWERGWGTIELGAGPGRGKPKPLKKSRHHAVMGMVIQAVIERMYNDELYREPQGLQTRLLDMIEKEWAHTTSKKWNFVDYRVAGSKDSLVQQCKDAITGYLRTMKHQKLIGEWTKAEFELLGWVDKYNPVGGRADLVFKRQDTGVTILDGKNSGTKGRYTNPDQLRWYAMLYYLAYRQMVDRLGFVYYRFPYGTPILGKDGQPTGEIETGVDWVPYTKDDLKGLAHRAVEARTRMNREQFPATPSSAACQWCEFETVCPARSEHKEAHRRPNKKNLDVIKNASDFVDFDL